MERQTAYIHVSGYVAVVEAVGQRAVVKNIRGLEKGLISKGT